LTEQRDDFPSHFTPEFVIASIGRSGSTLISNWLTHPPDRIVISEPVFFRLHTFQILRDQLAGLGMSFTDDEWLAEDADGHARFLRLFAPRLAGKHWAFKEVLSEQYNRVLNEITPPRVVLTVRHIAEVAASFLEKHRLQAIDNFFTPKWVRNYCLTETAALMAFVDRLTKRGIPFHVVRYEDFIASHDVQRALSDFVGWPGGGQTDRHLAQMNRAFEASRHGGGIGTAAHARSERALTDADERLVADLSDQCSTYQRRFGYA
jgi:hypothetical protein